MVQKYFKMDPDFRRTPKTDRYCWHCQRDLKSDIGVSVLVSIDKPLSLLNPMFSNEPHYSGLLGPECRRKYKVPKEFILRKESI